MIPFAHQFRAIERLSTRLALHHTAVDGSDTGTGKSATALWTAQVLRRRPLVVCPLAVVSAWQRTAADIGVPLLGVHHYEQIRDNKTAFFKRTPGGRKCAWTLPDDALLIFDEAQRCKGLTSLNSKMMHAAEAAPKVLALSATLASSPLELKALGRLLGWFGPWVGEYEQWCAGYGVVQGPFGPEFTGGATALRKLHEALWACGVRVRAEEIAEFPEGVVLPELIDVNEAEALATAQIAEIYAELDLKLLDDVPMPVVLLLRARQRAEARKLSWLLEAVLDGINRGKATVVMLNFRATLAALQQMLAARGVEADIIWGSTKRGAAKQADLDSKIGAFQANQRRAILLQIDSGGVGISLHDERKERPRESIISPGWSAVALRQALGRIRRLGGTAVVQRMVAVADTPESAVLRRLQGKLLCMDALNDGDLAWGDGNDEKLLGTALDEDAGPVTGQTQLQL